MTAVGLRRGVDKRAQFLALVGAAYVALGLSYIVTDTASRRVAFAWLPGALPGVGWLFLATTAACWLVAGFGRVLPLRFEQVAFMLATATPALTAVIFLVSWALGVAPNGWVSAVSYTWWAVIVWHVSDWDNPLHLHQGGDAP